MRILMLDTMTFLSFSLAGITSPRIASSSSSSSSSSSRNNSKDMQSPSAVGSNNNSSSSGGSRSPAPLLGVSEPFALQVGKALHRHYTITPTQQPYNLHTNKLSHFLNNPLAHIQFPIMSPQNYSSFYMRVNLRNFVCCSLNNTLIHATIPTPHPPPHTHTFSSTGASFYGTSFVASRSGGDYVCHGTKWRGARWGGTSQGTFHSSSPTTHFFRITTLHFICSFA